MHTPLTTPAPAAPPRRHGRVGALLTVNALLLCAAGAGLLASAASAQPGPGRSRGQYLMVSGRATGVAGNVVYVIDSVNQELLALRYQLAAGRLETMGYRSLVADSAQGAASR
ncbi:MAG: hypothetical protein K2Q09_10685 [Phycisphaerales bacterium]|nr:hypothetical protein [Phycisphaerales bacterium]